MLISGTTNHQSFAQLSEIKVKIMITKWVKQPELRSFIIFVSHQVSKLFSKQEHVMRITHKGSFAALTFDQHVECQNIATPFPSLKSSIYILISNWVYLEPLFRSLFTLTAAEMLRSARGGQLYFFKN